jgi:hypothetical protein
MNRLRAVLSVDLKLYLIMSFIILPKGNSDQPPGLPAGEHMGGTIKLSPVRTPPRQGQMRASSLVTFKRNVVGGVERYVDVGVRDPKSGIVRKFSGVFERSGNLLVFGHTVIDLGSGIVTEGRAKSPSGSDRSARTIDSVDS